MDTKLTLLFLLIGVMIGLSHLTETRLQSWRFRRRRRCAGAT